MNNRTTLYYFSATGNSLKAAMDIAQINGNTELISIDTDTKLLSHPESDKVGFVFPVYMGVLPKLVERFMENFPAKKGVYYFATATYYLYKGVALSLVDKALRKQGACLSYGNYIATVGTCLMEYEVTNEKREPIILKADKKTILIANEIKDNSETYSLKYYHLLVSMHKAAFRFIFGKAYKKFTLEDTCIGCGICEKVCPAHNISLVGGKPDWGNSCEACHACVHWCPQNAINLGRSKGRLQYHNPNITYKALLNSKLKKTFS